MSEKIIPLTLYEINEKLGSHKYEIIDISTEWCGPCKQMKKAMIKLLKLPEFADKDLCVYVINGDVCLQMQTHLDLIAEMEEKGLSFPIGFQEFTKLMVEAGRYSPFDIEEKANKIITDLGLELKDNIIYMTKSLQKLREKPIITKEFDVGGYPTLIFYIDGKPVTKPIDETAYNSRGIYKYNEEKFKDSDLSAAKMMEITIEKTVDRKKVKETIKAIQLNPKCDAKIKIR